MKDPRSVIIAAHVAPHLQAGARVLEIGAGNGHVAQELARQAQVDMRLIDIVDYNRSDLPLELYDGVRLPFADRSFDWCLLVFVLHHTPDPLLVAREALRVAHRGVILVENHVPGRVRQVATRLVDSVQHFTLGMPICYRAAPMEEWLELFEALPARARIAGRFPLKYIWDNFVAVLEQ